MSRQRYTPVFKDEAVRQVTDRGRPVVEVAERLGVSSHSLYKCVREGQPSKDEKRSDDLLESKKEVQRLRSELRQSPNLPGPTRGRRASRSQAGGSNHAQTSHTGDAWI